MDILLVLCSFGRRKTKPTKANIIVLRKSTGRLTAESQGLRDAYCEKEFEKTKPMLKWSNWR